MPVGHLDSSLAQVFEAVQMSGIFYCPSHLTEPWGIELPPMPGCLWFHVLTEGACTLTVDDQTFEVGPGDVVVVPHGHGHTARGREPAPVRSVFELPHEELTETYGRLRYGGGGAPSTVVCGGVRFEQAATQHLVDALPPIIHLRGAAFGRTGWLRPTLDLLADEIHDARAGNQAIISRLCDIVVIQAIRSWIEHDPDARSGWLGALRDPHIGAAISAIHADPSNEWTVALLATHAAMSRSAFAARFTQLVGEPPMAYVARWRMHRAAALLERGDHSVASVGRAVGYDSEAAFSRAYKRIIGTPPSGRTRSTPTWSA